MSVCENKVYTVLGLKLRLNWAQTHHGYYGIVLILGSIPGLSSGVLWVSIASYISFVIGAYLFADDMLWQHPKQVKQFNPCYHSPVHRFIYDYLKLYDRKWYRKLNQFADWLFASKARIIISVILTLILYIMLRG